MILKPATQQDLLPLQSYANASQDALLSDSVISQYIENQQLFVIEEQGVNVGFIAEQRVLDEAELLQIVIGSDFRNSGIATEALIRWHQRLAENKTVVAFLEVREGNCAAIGLYEKLGYTRIGMRKNYYVIAGKKYNAIVMQKILP